MTNIKYPQLIAIEMLRETIKTHGCLAPKQVNDLVDHAETQQAMLLEIIHGQTETIRSQGAYLHGVALSGMVSSLTKNIQALLSIGPQRKSSPDGVDVVDNALEIVSLYANGELRDPNEKELTRLSFYADSKSDGSLRTVTCESIVDLGPKSASGYQARLQVFRAAMSNTLRTAWDVDEVRCHTDEEFQAATI